MTIISKTIGSVGQVGVTPRRIQMVVTDALSVVTTANYLQADHLLPDTIYPTDIVDMMYSWNTSTNTGTYGEFLVSITAGVITLSQAEGSVALPTVVGDFAVYNSVAGGLEDLGYKPTNAALTEVVMQSGAAVVGDIPKYNDVSGTLIDSGITAASLSSVITQVGSLYQVSVTLNTAAVIAAYATPQTLIAAVAGKVAIVHSANVYTASTGNTAFATGVAPIIQYGTTVHGGGTIAVGTGLVTGDITAAASQVRTIGPAATAVYTGITDTAVTFSCSTAYTAGTGNSITFTLVYELISATV